MKNKFTLLLWVLSFGSLAWLIDTFLGFFYFYQDQTFLDLLLLAVPMHGVYVRVSFLFFILLNGFFYYLINTREEIIEAKHQKEQIKQRMAFSNLLKENINEIKVLIDQIRNPLAVILATCEVTEQISGEDLIINKVKQIELFVEKLEKRWIASETYITMLQSFTKSETEC